MIKTWNFPAGEVGVRVEDILVSNEYMIDLHTPNSDEIIRMLFLVDAIRRMKPEVRLYLNVPYFPYARQDRVMQTGESHSLKVIADLINSCDFERVYVADPHSDVVEAVVDNLTIFRQDECVRETIPNWDYQFLIAPDAGALKKIYKLSEKVGIPVICANKVRDVTNGKIVGVEISEQDRNKITGKVLVVDDIGDGMGTFIGLAEELKKTNSSELPDVYVTHGIFSKGLDILNGLYNKVYTYNLMNESMRNHVLLG